MNERILELAEQIPGWVSNDDGAYIGPHSSALKLYAELIVKECADYITESASIETLLGKKLLEHFGVE